MKKISAIIPCYNQAEFLTDCIESLFSQSYTNWEAIIINDGSTDHTEYIANSFKDDRIFYYKQENKGLPSARNKGLQMATGNYIQFLDADDMLDELKFEGQLSGIDVNNADIAISGYKAFTHPNIDDYVNTDTVLRGESPLHEFICRWEKGLCIPIHCFLYSRRVIDEVGLFRTDLLNHEDWDYHIRTSINNYIYCHDPSLFALYRVHDKSMCRSSDMEQGVVDVMTYYAELPYFPEKLKEFCKSEVLQLRPDATFKEKTKRNLLNVTFIIPVRIDTAQRLANVDFIIQYLQDNFNTHIVLAEEDSDSKLKERYENINHVFIANNNYIFHRTKLINDMVNQHVQTAYFCNLDSDIFIEPKNILLAVDMLKEYSVVYPYSGKFYDIPEQYNKNPDLTFDTVPKNERGLINPMSYGGCVFFRTGDFIEGGMENENFISWGCEDNERFLRFTKLGYKIIRLENPLYHFTHPRGINSNESNPYYLIGIKEYERILSMDKYELENYIKSTFLWTKK